MKDRRTTMYILGPARMLDKQKHIFQAYVVRHCKIIELSKEL
jgi:hypothetical protein